MRATLALTRWVWRARRAAVLGHVLPRIVLGMFVVVQADAVIDFPALSAELRALPALTVGALVGSLLLLQALSERRGIVALLWTDALGVAWRQPVPDRAWSVASGAVLAALAAPVAALAVLWYGPLAIDAVVLWSVCWLGIAGAAAFPGRRSLAALPGAAATVAVLAVAHAFPVVRPLLAVAVTLVFGVSWGPAYRTSVPRLQAPPAMAPWRPRWAWSALVQRDLLILWRTDRGAALAPLLVAPVVGLVALALQVNGGLRGSSLGQGVVVALAFIAPLIAVALGSITRVLGPQLDPPAWPLSRAHRGMALAVVAASCLVPSWAAASVAAPALGLAGQLRIADFVVLCAVGGAWFTAARRRRVNVGAWLWWILPCAFVACARWTWALPLSGALAAGAWWGTLRGLAHHRSRP